MALKFPHYQSSFIKDVQTISRNDSSIDGKEKHSQLWHDFQSGSESAYASIYKNNVALLYNYGLKLVNDKNLIKDCIQDLFVEIWNTKHKLGDVKSIKSYLYKSLRRKLISESIKNRKTTDISLLSDSDAEENPSFEHSLIEKQQFNQQRKKLRESIKKLTDRQKEIIHLKYYAHLSYEEISEVMSLSKKSTYKLMGRTIQFLRKNLNN
ncbi:sigma-70 family RNA polymerase sigma factor [Mariniflexile litorale]|uniref:Sigma-70 family RNA polymerase sigma factor n=1 Tax=Mariniflexile litorale TaxID=3045158 RepID=A0AAU7EBK7_9FLAO|nr:sigma-70 family RNA polymerase sigma factor [Mariniflexile sp. KMM 9835]MDQ8212890.1 sigma-70 family RNA polymerase sigma factor [Mariniflexile sp. KMM 9835]